MKKSADKIRRVGLIANFAQPSSRAVVRAAAQHIARAGRAVAADAQTAQTAGLHCEACADSAALARQTDLLLVFGGDGTMLRVVREINGAATPILGINMGRMGFLTAVSAQRLAPALETVWRGEFTVETRPLIEATTDGVALPNCLSALNDIVISRGAVSRLIELDVHVNNNFLTCYRGDGLIVSSPTGSTAYSLSAGGPIISPGAEVFAITPICAHALSNRAVIIGLDCVVRVRLLSKEMQIIVAADGQVHSGLAAGDTVTVRRSRKTARLLHPGESSFFETVRQKLHWRGSSV